MGLGRCQLVGEPVQFGSCKGLGLGEAALSLWVQTHRDCPCLSLVPTSLPRQHVCPKAEGAGEPELSTETDTFPGGEVRVLEIVLVEMEASCEVVGGLGQGTLCQEVSEELCDPASCCRWFCYLQMGNLLFVCTGERMDEATRVTLGKGGL